MTGMVDPVVQVADESTGQIVYTLRISGNQYTSSVFAPGLYTLHVGEPGTDALRSFTGVPAAAEPGDTLRVIF